MIVTGVWTGAGFSNLKNFWIRIRTRIPKFWDWSGVRVWKSDSDHLCYGSAILACSRMSHIMKVTELLGRSLIQIVIPVPEFVRKLWGCRGHTFAFRWRHHVHLTVLRHFCKTGKMGSKLLWYILGTIGQVPLGYAHGGGLVTGTLQWCYV